VEDLLYSHFTDPEKESDGREPAIRQYLTHYCQGKPGKNSGVTTPVVICLKLLQTHNNAGLVQK
jgi:hypothetical protein